MRSNLVLCVVDMQQDFSAASKPETIKACKKEILKAIRRKAPIVFLEWNHCGDTLKSLLKLVDNYRWHRIVTKSQDDGSSHLVRTLKDMGRSPKKSRYRICGVNTDACVYRTVKGLRQEFPDVRIEVAAKACNASYSHTDGLLRMKNLPGIRILDFQLKSG